MGGVGDHTGGVLDNTCGIGDSTGGVEEGTDAVGDETGAVSSNKRVFAYFSFFSIIRISLAVKRGVDYRRDSGR